MKKILFTLLLLLSGSSFALAPVTMYALGDISPGTWFSTAEAACTQGSYGFTYHGDTRCYNSGGNAVWIAASGRCAGGAQPNYSLPLNQQCPDPTPRPADPNCPAGYYTAGVAENPNVDESSRYICLPIGEGDVTAPSNAEQCSYRNPTTGKCEAMCPNGSVYKQVPTGAMACVRLDTSPPPEPPNTDCPRGYMNISATAEPNCTKIPDDKKTGVTPPPGSAGETTKPTPATSEKATTPKQTTTNPDGSTTETSSTTTKNRDGSTTTTTTTKTTGTDGKVTETSSSTTGKTADGKDGKSDSQKNDETDLCIRHPELAVCKVSSVTKADCAATTCEGDAIQCAILRSQIQAACSEKGATDAVKNSASHALGSSALTGNDPLGSTLPTKANGGSWSMPTSLNNSGWLGGGSCFSDKSFSIQGQTIVIPFSSACDYLIVFRYVLMIIATWVAFRMLSGVILKD